MISRQVEARTDERHLEEQRLQNDLIKKNSHTFNYVLSYEFTGITRMGLEHFGDIFFSSEAISNRLATCRGQPVPVQSFNRVQSSGLFAGYDKVCVTRYLTGLRCSVRAIRMVFSLFRIVLSYFHPSQITDRNSGTSMSLTEHRTG